MWSANRMAACRLAALALSAVSSASCEAKQEKGTSSSTSSTTSTTTSTSTSMTLKGPNVKWAFPSPYDADIPKDRFVSVEHLKKPSVDQWDLKELVRLWEEEGEESWPWVWTAHNPMGPHYVFYGVSKHTLTQAKAIAEADRRNNLTVVVSPDELKKHNINPEDLYKCRCAVIDGEIKQMDVVNKILMLADERIICYDFAYMS